jgi:DNA-binding beta-propeller fold protein YncE
LRVGVAAGREGDIYVSDSGLQTILVYDSRGKFVRHLKKTTEAESYFDSVQGIGVDSVTGRIYVCDRSRHMVFALNQKGRVLARFGTRFGGDGPAEFRYPTQVVPAGGEIVVLDSGNYRIQILDVRGHFLKQFPLPDVSNGSGLAMDGDGKIYLSDPQLNQLQVFNHNGEFLYRFGETGAGEGKFNGISGIWVDSGHCLYVADSQNQRVQLFKIAGANADDADPRINSYAMCRQALWGPQISLENARTIANVIAISASHATRSATVDLSSFAYRRGGAGRRCPMLTSVL